MVRRTVVSVVATLTLFAGPTPAQVQTEIPPAVPGAKPVTVEHIKIHGKSLEGNLEGDAVDRDVLVFLPPSYNADKTSPLSRRLRHARLLHRRRAVEPRDPRASNHRRRLRPGRQRHDRCPPRLQNRPQRFHVLQLRNHRRLENFIARDVVAYIDAHYRTIPNRMSRGLVGHSMGGYGASRIGMKHSDVFGSLYIMSPCCLSPRGAPNPEISKALEAIKNPSESASLPFGARAQLASAAAWSPDPKNPPLYLDLPTKDGVPQPEVIAKWAANAPLAFVDQYIANLRQYHAIAMDVGDQDNLRFDAGMLHDVFDKYGIANTFEIYHGTHTSAVADRFQNHVLPFFSKNLCSTNSCN